MWVNRARALIAVLIALSFAPAARADDALATYSCTRGWATFGIALPPNAAANGVQVGRLPTQTDVKVRWPDGSIRFGVVSVRVANGGTYAIASAPRTQGEFAPTLPPASVTFTIGGKPYVASLPSVLTDSWLAGPLVSERRAVVAPGGHPFDVAVENCLDVAGADSVTYDVVVTVGDVRVYSQTGVKHKYLARWRKVFTTGGLKEASVAPDMAPFVAARALPPFLPTVAAPNRSTTGNGVSGTGFRILGFGDLTVPMNAHSGRPELAPYPDWTAQFLVHRTAPLRAYMLLHGELAGSWGVHVRKPDGSMPSIDARGSAYYWLDPRWRDPGNMLGGF